MKEVRSHARKLALSALALASAATCAIAASGQSAVLARYAELAKAADAAFAGFSADRGKAFFLSSHATGSPETPSCATCHTQNPQNMGQTRAGKEILPMAVSKTADRFTDFAKTEKWFARNCKSVLGRECTPVEKGDFITFLAAQ